MFYTGLSKHKTSTVENIVQLKFEKYKRKKKEFLQSNKSIKNVFIRKKIRPLLRFVLFLQRKFNGESIEFINKQIPKTNKPIVFAVSHIGKKDFEIVNEVIKEHFHILASDFVNMYGNINGLFMNLNGVIFIDVESKEDRENSRKMMLKVLDAGDNMMIFPEGTWNISENQIINDIHFGAVDIALEKQAVIVPIAIEQYGKRFVINMGETYEPSKMCRKITDKLYIALDDKNGIERDLKLQIKLYTTRELRDRLATLKFEIWEKEGTCKREQICYDYWKEFINERLAEWPGYSMDEQIKNGCFPSAKREYRKMLEQICRMKIRDRNAFLFGDVENKKEGWEIYGKSK